MRWLRFISAIAPLLAAASAFGAEPEIVATVDRQEVAIGDEVTLSVSVSYDKDPSELQLPEAPDFDVVSRPPPSEQTSFSFINGAASFKRSKLYRIVLAPKRPGTFTIRGARMVVNGKQYRTGDLQVRVVKASQAPARPKRQQPQSPFAQSPFGQSPFGQLPFGGFPGMGDEPDEDPFSQLFGGGVQVQGEKDLFVRSVVDKAKVYLGEQTTLSIYLFSRVPVSQVDRPKPKLDGFWAEDLDTAPQLSEEVRQIDGQSYHVYLLRKFALFPTRAGKLVIDSVDVDIATGLSAFFSGQHFHRNSSSCTVDVLPLPSGAPAGFPSVNVGQWRVSADGRPVSTVLSQPVTYVLTVEGYGNLHNLDLPKPPPISGLKFFDPTSNQKTTSSKNKFGGRRTAEYLVVPERTGRFEIPALEFDYFNPYTKAYEKSRTTPVVITVAAGGTATAQAGTSGLPAEPGAQNVLASSALRPVRFTNATLSRGSPPLYLRRGFIPALGAPWLLWAFFAAVGAVRTMVTREDAGSRRRRAASRARRRLKRAESLAKSGKVDDFYGEVSRVVRDYLSDKLGENVTGLTRDQLTARLLSSGAGGAVSAVCQTLDACDAGRFAPDGSQKATLGRVLEAASEAMEAMESRRPPPRPVEATS
jgi:hypothetical protein